LPDIQPYFMNRLIFLSVCLLCTDLVSAQDTHIDPLHVSTDVTASQVSAFRFGTTLGTGRISAGTGNALQRTVSLRLDGIWGSIAFDKQHLQRFGLSDSALALDAYPRLWRGAYANVRYQRSGAASLYPNTSWRAELYQNVGDGWEISASRDELKFSSPVQMDGLGLAKYWGNLYLRWRHQHVSSNISAGNSDRFVVRYYYEGDADHYLEASISNGRSADDTGNVITSSRSDTRGLVWYHFLDRTWGVKASVSQSKDSSLAGAHESSASLNLTYRW
jgi:YaiO family outer membrane protein